MKYLLKLLPYIYIYEKKTIFKRIQNFYNYLLIKLVNNNKVRIKSIYNNDYLYI